MRRRDFIRLVGLGGSAGLLAGDPLSVLAQPLALPGEFGPLPTRGVRSDSDSVRLVIIHTNDTHSRLDPFPQDGGPFAGLGGAARRATLIRRIREANEHVLLLDSGDILQGTPYFNFFAGELEFRAMSAMGYDFATLGNHDFDNGVDGLADILPEASFQFVSANYAIDPESPLAGKVLPYAIREVGGVLVGVFGLGISFERLVLARLHKGVSYQDPFAAARAVSRELRDAGCALVICLSHLGYAYRNPSRPSDRTLAEAVPEVDIILGGHTHTFLNRAEEFAHPGDQAPTLVNQTGWGGMRLGRIDVAFEHSTSTPGWGWASASYDIDAQLDA